MQREHVATVEGDRAVLRIKNTLAWKRTNVLIVRKQATARECYKIKKPIQTNYVLRR